MSAILHFFLNLIINADLFLQFLMLIGVLLMIGAPPCQRVGRWVILCSAVPFFIISWTPLVRYGFIHLENRYPRLERIQDDFFGFILLGGSLDKFLTAQGGGERAFYDITCPRLIEFVEIAEKYPDKPIIFTGTPDEATYEVQALVMMGIEKSRIKAYPNALNTIDNAQNTYRDYQPTPNQRFILVTSAFHMPRSMGLFQGAGWNVEACPVDYHTIGKWEKVPMMIFWDRKNLLAWHAFTKEWECMINNYMQGRSKALFPGPLGP